MYAITQVRWTIIPLFAPRPWITCGDCGTLRPFSSSGKVRLNANGKKLDAWLIYKCCDCDRTWNRPLFERRPLKQIDPTTLEALHFSDPARVRAREFDVDDLRRKARRIDECAEVEIRKETSSETGHPAMTVIELEVALPTCLRLDRLLSMEFGLSRAGLQALHAEARLRIEPDRKDALRRRIRDGTRIILETGAGQGLGDRRRPSRCDGCNSDISEIRYGIML